MTLLRSSTNAIAIALLLTASAAAAAEESQSKPGDGVLCAWALTVYAAEVGRRCPGKADPAFQAGLDESVALLDHYVSVNGHADAATIAKFKRQQGGVGRSVAPLCRADTVQMYDRLHEKGPAFILEATRKIVARPGMPAWGDCL